MGIAARHEWESTFVLVSGGGQRADDVHVKYNLFVFFLVSLELCPGSTVWRPRAGMAHLLVHLTLMLREMSNDSVLHLRKWVTELLVQGSLSLFIPRGMMGVCLVLSSFWPHVGLGG